MDSQLVTLVTTVSTSTSRCGNHFRAMGWQFITDILQGVVTLAGKIYIYMCVCVKRDNFEKSSEKIHTFVRNAHLCSLILSQISLKIPTGK